MIQNDQETQRIEKVVGDRSRSAICLEDLRRNTEALSYISRS